MKFIRLVRPNLIAGMSAREGFFCSASELREDPFLDAHSSDRLEDHLQWFRTNLTIPDRFSRSQAKGAVGARGLSWFKDTASEPIDRAFDLVAMLRDFGYHTEKLVTSRVGYIVYDDAHQVVAEPFSDTPV